MRKPHQGWPARASVAAASHRFLHVGCADGAVQEPRAAQRRGAVRVRRGVRAVRVEAGGRGGAGCVPCTNECQTFTLNALGLLSCSQLDSGPVPRRDWGLRGCGYKPHSVGPCPSRTVRW